ncbi:acetyl-CoA carboxylase carboxyltransferase subunit alpha [Sinomonas mesophila]|uniref:acetyl-CoA carboxylase carboxyltransferase subunit alpha n=1 Tax=Sinomonas mesophila TaxID=1531955 RepID=UPI0009871197|nr:acetyl-CoA carboxylase carboxyltransferase subunit alpha [Sinomonas mesophila]
MNPSDTHATWHRCPGCQQLHYLPRVRRSLGVCPGCGRHHRLGSRERLDLLADPGSFVPAEDLPEVRSVDVLGFTDTRPYPERLDGARRRTGLTDAAVYGTARIEGQPAVVVVMDFAFMGGSMGSAVGELVTRAAESALESRLPLLVVCASGGARMQEGPLSLMQMAKTGQAFGRLREAGILSVCLLTDPTYGGVTASFAMLGDLVVAEPGAMIGFAGPGVIRQTIGEELPEGFQTAEFLLEHGMLDAVLPRSEARGFLGRVFGAWHQTHGWDRAVGTAGALGAVAAVVRDPSRLPRQDAAATVRLARTSGRPTTLDYLALAFDSFTEFHGDRLGHDSKAIVGGLALLEGVPVIVVGHQKGRSTRESVLRNFGMPEPDGYRKALRLMKLAVTFGVPVVTLIDTPGAYPGIDAEKHGQAVAIAESILEASRLPVPVVACVTGEGGSGGALALAVADRVLTLENSYYSVISPEGCATILFNDAGQAHRAAEALRLTPADLLDLGVVDAVVREPDGGAHLDAAATAERLRAALVEHLTELVPLGAGELVERRQGRFRAFGAFEPFEAFGDQAAVVPLNHHTMGAQSA